MSKIQADFTPIEFDRVLIALNWYIDDRETCARIEERSIYDADANESRKAARQAERLLSKLRRLI